MLEQLITTVRELAALSPDNVYGPPPGEFRIGYYHKGECSNGSIGCIFGQAFKSMGLKVPEAMDIISDVLFHEFNVVGWSPRLEWCEQVQRYQDMGHSWHRAITLADKDLGGSVNREGGAA